MRKSALLFVAAVLLVLPLAAYSQTESGVLRAAGTTCPTAGACVTLQILENRTGASIQIDPTFTGTIQFEATTNDGTWNAIDGFPIAGGASESSATAVGTWQFPIAGITGLRARMSIYGSGAAGVTIKATNGVPVVGTTTSVPSGTQDVDVVGNTIGLSTGAKQDAQTALLTTMDASATTTATNTGTTASGVGATTVDRCTTTDTTSCALIGLVKQLNYLLNNPVCPNQVVYDTNTNGKTQLVALASSKVIYVCGVHLVQSTTSAVTVSLGSGTGSNCASTYTAKTPAWVLPAASAAAIQGVGLQVSSTPWFQTAASEELCISTNAAVAVQAIVVYGQP